MNASEYHIDFRNYNRTGRTNERDQKRKLEARRRIEELQEQRELDALTDMNSPDYFA